MARAAFEGPVRSFLWGLHTQTPKRPKVTSCLTLSQDAEIKHLVKVNSPPCDWPTNVHVDSFTQRVL